jgi:CRISPR/Cas system-associated exonuclease Cas4 (RecB family)
VAEKKEFKNRFSWSFSRDNAFNTCKRKYYYSYYGSWGGWNKDADELSKKLYLLNKMSSLPMLAGTIVHDEVERTLKAVRYGRNADIVKSKENVIKVFKQSWAHSKNKDWKDNPKCKTNLFEHFYNQKPTDEALLDIRDLMLNSIDGFFASDSYRFIQTMSDSQWLAIEDLDSFEVHGAKLWVKLDFAIRHGERVYIYDWKTGKVAKENEVQLAIYALYAQQKWNVDLKLIRLFDVYLNQQLPVKVKPTNRLIDSAKVFIEKSIDSMKELLTDVENNETEIELFPVVGEDRESYPCSYCSFQTVCFD